MADSGLDCLGAGGLDGFKPMVEDGAEHFDELTVAVALSRSVWLVLIVFLLVHGS